ncbi:hypothetical protein NL676_038118 [Syzygium grande]|nr:hypothetical protein NL676_038118 [Syzygium grande]
MDLTGDSLREELADNQATINALGSAIRALEASRAPKPEIDAAIVSLNDLRINRASIEKQLWAAVSGTGNGTLTREPFLQGVVNTLKCRPFYILSFKIYHGVAVFYVYSSHGCAVRSNVLAFWL